MTPRTMLRIGSEERDKTTLQWLLTCWNSQQRSIKDWENTLATIEKERTWERWPPEKPAGSLDALLVQVIGINKAESLTAVQINAENHKNMGKQGRPTKEEQKNKPVNKQVIQYGSTNAEYLTARIARDRPDILERMKAGEFRSVRAAAKEAGIVKDKKYWQAPCDIEELAAKIINRFSEDEIQQLLEELTK
jgi:ribosomal protein L44E